MIRDSLKIQVATRPDSDEADPAEVDKITKLVDRYRGLVFDDNKVGCIRTKPIHLDYEIEATATTVSECPNPLST